MKTSHNNTIKTISQALFIFAMSLCISQSHAAELKPIQSVVAPNSIRNDYNSYQTQYNASPRYNQPVQNYQTQYNTQPQFNQPVNNYSQPQYNATPSPPAQTSPDEKQQKITSRYTSSQMRGFLSRTSMQQLSSLYLEVSQMIDARHVSPSSYEQRTMEAAQGLAQALDNPAFLQTNGANVNSNNIRSTQNELIQTAQQQPARSAQELVGVMQWSAELVSRQTGIRREAVALEFMNATIDSLDKYSSFMPAVAGYSSGATLEPTKYAVQKTAAGLDENIVGVGVEMKSHDRGALLVGVVENSPAHELKLQEGDIIIAVNQRSIQGQNLNQIADQIAGPSGSSVSVDIDRNGQKYRGSMVRRSFYVSSVTGTKMIDPAGKVGYTRLKHFSESSTKDLEAAMWKLHNQGMTSLVLDLRGNPGGLLDQAITVSDLFLPKGNIVSTRGRNSSDNTSESANFQKTWGIPLVVLVDGNSASASEIFGAAIQENGRGVIVGRKSYGKGTVQTHFPLRTVSGNLKLTTAKFYSPNGREMAGTGVTPDVLVNETTTGYRGADNDTDVNTAVQVIRQGTPAQMASNSASNQPTMYQSFQTQQQYQTQPTYRQQQFQNPNQYQPRVNTPGAPNVNQSQNWNVN